MAQETTSDYVPGGFRLTGWRVLGILVLFFGTISAVDFTMVHYALSTYRGETTAHPYEEGLAYNRELARAKAQAALNWTMDVKADRAPDGKVSLDLRAHDRDGKPLSDLQVTLMLQAPADMRRDLRVQLIQTGPGQYHGETEAAAGNWVLALDAMQNGTRMFQSFNRVMLE